MKNYKLEFIRGFASLMVFITHLVVSKPELQNPYVSIISNWGTESVMAFFILSGVVIAMTYYNSRSGYRTYMERRLMRLYPLLVISLLLAYAMMHFHLLKEVRLSHVIGNFLLLGTLNAEIVPVPDTNIPVWSLSYEMFFYLVFGLMYFFRNERFMFGWLIVSLLAVPPYYMHLHGVSAYIISHLAFSAPWIAGFMAYHYADRLKWISLKDAMFFAAMLPGIAGLDITSEMYCVIKYDLFALAAFPVFVYAINMETEKTDVLLERRKQVVKIVLFILIAFSLYYFSEARKVAKVLYLAAPLGVMLFSGLVQRVLHGTRGFLVRSAYFLGSVSYGLYIIHFPLLMLLNAWIESPLLFIVAGTVTCFSIAYLLEKRVQPAVVRMFRQASGHKLAAREVRS